MASFPSSAKSARKGSDVAVSYENHTVSTRTGQEREGGRGGNLNGRAGKMTQDACPPRRVLAWDTALHNPDSTTEDKPPAYEEPVPINDGYVAVDGVYTEMEYADPPRIIVGVKTLWWSKKRIIILVAFLLVLLGGISCAVIFPMGLVLKSGGNNPLEDSALKSTSTSISTSTSTTSSTTTSSTTSTSSTASAKVDLIIDPPYLGKKNLIFRTDGDLNFGNASSYTMVPIVSFSATIKMWGAGGGPGGSHLVIYPPTIYIGFGGGGGFSAGTYTFQANSSYQIYIGRGGRRDNITNLNTAGATYLSGGVQKNDVLWGSEGGGLSGIFIGQGSYSQASAIIIAGGGGGGSNSQYTIGGSAGGGTSGGPTDGGQSGRPGTQMNGGQSCSYNGCSNGKALTGGLGQNYQACLGGGGGGYWGGGGGNVGGGGGGSGFVGGIGLTDTTTTTGANNIAGNSVDFKCSGAGQGRMNDTMGSDGKVIITFISYS